MSFILPHLAPSVFTVPANQRVAVYSLGLFTVSRSEKPNIDEQIFGGVGYYLSPIFTVATQVTVAGGQNFPTFYSIGTNPIVYEYELKRQGDPGELNTTGTLTPALILGEIVTSTTAAAVTGTLATGAEMDAASTFNVNDFWDWKIINTGPNTFSVQQSTGHTVVGSLNIASGQSQRFRTRKTAANTFVSYRI